MSLAQQQPIVKRGRGRPPKNPQAYQADNMPIKTKDELTAPSQGDQNAQQFKDASKDFQCNKCGKSYLSNPALYLHMKIKHMENGNGVPQEQMKRGRGRPRKDGYSYHGSSGPGGRLDPTSDLFLKNEQRDGGPTDPLLGFADNVLLLFGNEKYGSDGKLHPMHPYMAQFAFQNTPGGPSDQTDGDFINSSTNGGKMRFKEMSLEILNMSEPRKNMLNCDELFAIYLRECSSQVNENYYTTMVQFVLMFRDCLNMYGWQKRAENECKEYYGQFEYEKVMRKKLEEFQEQSNGCDYTDINNAEFAPEICNEYVTVYMEMPGNNPGKIGVSEIIDLTQHFCHWLFQNKLTCSKLSMVRS